MDINVLYFVLTMFAFNESGEVLYFEVHRAETPAECQQQMYNQKRVLEFFNKSLEDYQSGNSEWAPLPYTVCIPEQRPQENKIEPSKDTGETV